MRKGDVRMPRRRRHVLPKAEPALDRFKYEVADDLGLKGDIQDRGWENMTTREVGKIGGNMVRRMIERAERDMAGRDTAGEEYGTEWGNTPGYGPTNEWAAWPGSPEFTRREASRDRPDYIGRRNRNR